MTTETMETTVVSPPPLRTRGVSAQPEPRLHDGDDDMDDDMDDDGGDDDGPPAKAGFLVTWRDGRKESQVLYLPDDDMDEDDARARVLSDWDRAWRDGTEFFSFEDQRIRVSDVASFGWSEGVALPEQERFDSLQDRLESLADMIEDVVKVTMEVNQSTQALHAAMLEAVRMDAVLSAQEDRAEEEAEEEEAVAHPAVLKLPPAPGVPMSPPAPAAPAASPPPPAAAKGKLRLPGME